jgi:hypothetical protein
MRVEGARSRRLSSGSGRTDAGIRLVRGWLGTRVCRGALARGRMCVLQTRARWSCGRYARVHPHPVWLATPDAREHHSSYPRIRSQGFPRCRLGVAASGARARARANDAGCPPRVPSTSLRSAEPATGRRKGYRCGLCRPFQKLTGSATTPSSPLARNALLFRLHLACGAVPRGGAFCTPATRNHKNSCYFRAFQATVSVRVDGSIPSRLSVPGSPSSKSSSTGRRTSRR